MKERRWLKLLLTKRNKHQDQGDHAGQSQPPPALYAELQQNEYTLHTIYANCSDVIFRSFLVGGSTRAILVYIEGLSDSQRLEQFVIAPLLARKDVGELGDPKQLIDQTLSVPQVKPFTTFAECVEYISNGFPVLICDKGACGLALGLNHWEKRAIEEPSSEVVIRGPHEGFTETLRINTSQMRRIIKSPLLKMETMTIGEYTRTKVVVAYIEGIADAALVEEIKHRLERIRIDGILESGYIEEMIEDNPYSPFPQILSTERPDVICGSLLEGRAAILVEGTPVALVAPITLFSLMQSAEDYYQRFWMSSFIRWIRYGFAAISLMLPSFYVAILTFHHEMVPSSLLVSIASSREMVPFPAVVEVVLMEVFFEALREAGIRLPKQIGAAVSIVGALVIGQAAVQAGLVSAPMVIVVASTGIASFLIPRHMAGFALRMLRFPMMFFAASLGILGIIMFLIAIVLHLCSLRSFGVPYLSSVSAPRMSDMKDILVRAPWWKMDTRPSDTQKYNVYRQASDQKPGPEQG